MERGCAREAEGKPRRAAGKNIMGRKLAFALVLASVALVSAFAAGGEPDNEGWCGKRLRNN